MLCLDREQRLVYILGEIFGVTDAVGAALLETSRDNFRQKLTTERHVIRAADVPVVSPAASASRGGKSTSDSMACPSRAATIG